MAELHPALKPQEADKILSSIQEWMIKQATNPTNPTEDVDKGEFRRDTSISPSVAPVGPPTEPSGKVAPGRPLDPSQEKKRASAAINLFGRMKLVVGVILIAFVVGVVWHAYRDNQTRNPIRASLY